MGLIFERAFPSSFFSLPLYLGFCHSAVMVAHAWHAKRFEAFSFCDCFARRSLYGHEAHVSHGELCGCWRNIGMDFVSKRVVETACSYADLFPLFWLSTAPSPSGSVKPNLSLVSVNWWTSARNLPANGAAHAGRLDNNF
jgi:hypothetical protein